jgi:hypothetical protein
MAAAYRIIDVAPDSVMQVAVNTATRQHATGKPTRLADVQQVTGLSEAQARNALIMAVQLRMLNESPPGEFAYTGSAQLRNSVKEGLPQFFRAAAQQFPPFLFYVGFLARGYDPLESARQSSSIFGIGLGVEKVTSIFGRWSKYTGIIDAHGNLDFRPQEILTLGFINRLHEALQAELSAQTFVLNELGAVAADLYTRGLDLNSIGKALVNHERSPNDALREAGSLLESYLAQSSKAAGGPGALLVPLVDFLSGSGQKQILKSHKNLVYGVAGFRNAADHGSDPDTGEPWSLTPEAALVGVLLVLLAMRSIARYMSNGTQEV